MGATPVGLRSLRSSILVDINCIIDQEVGLIRLVARDYMDEEIFDYDEINKGIIHIINKLYYRKVENPLIPFAKPDISTELLDRFYEQFKERKVKDILLLSPTTDMKRFLKMLSSEGNIEITILCHNNYEYQLMSKISSFSKYKKIKASDIKDVSKYFQLYFKFAKDIEDKFIYECRTYYISTHRLNFEDDNETFKDKDIIIKLIDTMSEISIIDLYNEEYLQEENKND